MNDYNKYKISCKNFYKKLFEHNFIPRKEVVKSVLNPEEIANKTVPRHVFVRLKQELEEKNELINILHQKVSHLESLIKLKDQRITDLTSQIIKPIEQSITPRTFAASTISKLRTKI